MFNRMHGKSSKGFDVCVPDIMEYIIYHDSGTSRESDSDGDSYRSCGFVDGCFRFVPVMKSVNILVHRLDVDKPVGEVEVQLPVYTSLKSRCCKILSLMCKTFL